MINKNTGNRLEQQMVDAETGDVVDSDQKGRGYELRKGHYVEVEKDDLEAVQIESTHTIEIDALCRGMRSTSATGDSPITSRLTEKTRLDAFAVIRDAMKRKDRVALGRIVMANREHVIALEPLDKDLFGTPLRYPYELRDEEDYFDDIGTPRITKDMVKLAELYPLGQIGAFRPVEVQRRIRACVEGARQTQGGRQDDYRSRTNRRPTAAMSSI